MQLSTITISKENRFQIKCRKEINHMCNAHEGAIEQGKEIGERNGKRIRSYEIAKNLLLLGASIEMIVQGTGLSFDDVNKLCNMMKQG